MFNNIIYHVTGLKLQINDRNSPDSVYVVLTLTPHKDKQGIKGKFKTNIKGEKICLMR